MPDFDPQTIISQTFVAEVEYHPSLGSTNDRALRRGREGGAKLPLVVLAGRQTAGRGRGAKRWWCGPGCLAFSLLFGPEQLRPGRGSLVSLAAALAVVETVGPLVPDRQIGIHWPNDVMVANPAVAASDRKLSGILIEVLPDGQHVVGIGLNVNASAADAPPELRTRLATLLDLTGRRHDLTVMLVSALQHMERQLARLARTPEEIAARADSLCLQRGKMLTVAQGGRAITGRCAGIAPDGSLRLETAEGECLLHSGEML